MKILFVIFALIILSAGKFSFAQDAVIYDPAIAQLLENVAQDSIKSHIENLAEAGGHQSRVSYTAGNEWAADYIYDRLVAYAGHSAVQFDTFYVSTAADPYRTMPLVNVIATIPGSTDSTMYFVIGGHFDATANRDPNLSWETDWKTALAPGADDNATGVAAALEIARVLTTQAQSYQPAVTIKIAAFGAEERHPVYGDGHKGSGDFVVNAYADKDNIAGAFILDMFGFNNTGNDYINIVSDSKSVELGQTMVSANQVYQIGLNLNAEPFPYATYSDHDRFWIYRYKAILVIENAPPWSDNLPWYTLNPYYHFESDTPDKINYEQVFKTTQLTLASVLSMANMITEISSGAEVFSKNQDFDLLATYPNPFNGMMTIEYRLNSIQKVVLDIYNLSGQKVSNLINDYQPAGQYSIKWRATGTNGSQLPTGIYFVSLNIDNRITTSKIMFLK